MDHNQQQPVIIQLQQIGVNFLFRGKQFQFPVWANFGGSLMDRLIGEWIYTSDEHTPESLCDFVIVHQPDKFCYSRKDMQIIQWTMGQRRNLA